MGNLINKLASADTKTIDKDFMNYIKVQGSNVFINKKKSNIDNIDVRIIDIKTEIFISKDENYLVSPIQDDDKGEFSIYGVRNKLKTSIGGENTFDLNNIEKIKQEGYKYSIKNILFLINEFGVVYSLTIGNKSIDNLYEFLKKNGDSCFRLKLVNFFSNYYGFEFNKSDSKVKIEVSDEIRTKVDDYIKNYNLKFIDKVEEIDLSGKAE